MNNKPQDNIKSDIVQESDEDKKETYQIFVGAIHPEMTEDVFTEYFSKHGKVAEVRLMKDKITKKFRGFGFVSFEEEATRTAVLAEKEHVLMNKKMDVKIAISREETNRRLKDECSRKLYVTGITPDVTKNVLRNFFKEFGEIENIKVKYHTKSGNDFAFILYKNKDGLDNALVSGEDREIVGVKIKCERTLLRDDLKKTQMEEGKKRKKKKAERKKKKRQKKQKADNIEKVSSKKDSKQAGDNEAPLKTKQSEGSSSNSKNLSIKENSNSQNESMVKNLNTSKLTHQGNASLLQQPLPPNVNPPNQGIPPVNSYQPNYPHYYPPNGPPPYPYGQPGNPYWAQQELNRSYQGYPPHHPQQAYTNENGYNLNQSFNLRQGQAATNGYQYNQNPGPLRHSYNQYHPQQNLPNRQYQRDSSRRENQLTNNQDFKVIEEGGNFQMDNLETKFSTDHLSDIGNETEISFKPLRGFEPKRVIADGTQSEKNSFSDKSGKLRGRGAMSFNSASLKKKSYKSSSELERERLKAIMDQDYIDDTASVTAQSGKWNYSGKTIKEEDEFVCIDEEDFEGYPELEPRQRTQLQVKEKSKAQNEINHHTPGPEDEFLMGFKVVEKSGDKLNDSRYVCQNAEIYTKDDQNSFKSVWKVWHAN